MGTKACELKEQMRRHVRIRMHTVQTGRTWQVSVLSTEWAGARPGIFCILSTKSVDSPFFYVILAKV